MRARIYYQTFVPPLRKGSREKDRKRSRKNHMEVNTVKSEVDEDNSPREKESKKKVTPHEEVLAVPFKQESKGKTFRIGTKLGKDHQRQLIALVREFEDVLFEDVFAWGPEDMRGIDPAVVVHRLYMDPNFSPIKQKKTLFNDEKNIAIREEV
ncbi:hypothetical protein LIER_00558 [Lithospermum erythrorhizon]|uniref:Uncharacterized protein n=1 Tax=Lithospermum erythrorhizon TaxID=34254 RepID=A0AAV3NJ36_LITER